ncbi:hypothetical protein LINGRAHAP2_LOCUS22793, partial [Linum grandiflorum]
MMRATAIQYSFDCLSTHVMTVLQARRIFRITRRIMMVSLSRNIRRVRIYLRIVVLNCNLRGYSHVSLRNNHFIIRGVIVIITSSPDCLKSSLAFLLRARTVNFLVSHPA